MLIKQFKKDYLPYLLGIIIPAGVSFVTIPLLKNILGPADFGVYTFYLSILLIINSSFSGGVTQSIIRLHVDNDRNTFYYHSLIISFFVSLVICIPLFIYILSSYHLISFALLFVASLFLANIYIPVGCYSITILVRYFCRQRKCKNGCILTFIYCFDTFL